MNILILAAQYPTLDDLKNNKITFFMHDYAKNWANLGHNVLVIHSMPVYPKQFDLISNSYAYFSPQKGKSLKLYKKEKSLNKTTIINKDNITYIRIPIKKYIPHGMYFSRDIKKTAKEIKLNLEEVKFSYDLIITDFLNPSIFIAEKLNETKKVKTYCVLHETDMNYLNNRLFGKKFLKAISINDGIGFRSQGKSKEFIENYFTPKFHFHMLSGVPNNLLASNIQPRSSVLKIVTVSRLISRKNINTIIEAVSKTHNRFELEIIGEGPERESLESLAKDLGVSRFCTFTNPISRNEVIAKIREADCFILVSQKETFGMVYIEAMSQGCVVIGSKGEGIDSIIINNENGYLVESGNVTELSNLLNELVQKPISEISKISTNAYLTASKLSEEKLAEDVLAILRNNMMEKKNE